MAYFLLRSEAISSILFLFSKIFVPEIVAFFTLNKLGIVNLPFESEYKYVKSIKFTRIFNLYNKEGFSIPNPNFCAVVGVITNDKQSEN